MKVTKSNIRLLAEKIKQKFNPKKIILFGSYAIGNPKKESDIDLLVIMETVLKPYQQAALIRLALDDAFGVTHPMDIVVRTPLELEKRINEGDFFFKTILKTGVLL